MSVFRDSGFLDLTELLGAFECSIDMRDAIWSSDMRVFVDGAYAELYSHLS
jgi:hypothetical protein